MLRVVATALLSLLLAACAAAPPPAPAERAAARQLRVIRAPAPAAPVSPAAHNTAPVAFVDVHVHLNDAPMQLELMQRFGVERAVVFWGRNSDNGSVAAMARQHPDRFIAFASVSPERASYRQAWDADDTTLLKQLDELLASGQFRGIGEISVTHFPSPGFPEADYNPSGFMTRGILALGRKHRLPVMLHVELTRLRELSALLDEFVDVPVIWAHGGYTPLFIAQRMLAQHPNLYYELSARTWPVHPRSPDYTLLHDGQHVWPQWLALIEAQPDRFLVGSDASHRSLDSDTAKLESVQSFLRQLSPAAQERVARGNILKLIQTRP